MKYIGPKHASNRRNSIAATVVATISACASLLLTSCTPEIPSKQTEDNKKSEAFDLARAASRASNVCEFVVDIFNHGQLQRIAQRDAAIRVGDKEKFVSIEQGSGCSSHYIKIMGDDSSPYGPYLREAGEPDDIVIVPFRDVSYFVTLADGAPEFVIKPEAALVDDVPGGTVCGFNRASKSVLAENHSDRVCKKFLAGEIGDEAAWQDVPEGSFKAIDPADVGISAQPGEFTKTTDVHFSAGDKGFRVGHFSMQPIGTCGYDRQGIALLDGNSFAKGEPNVSLMRKQIDPFDVGDATLVNAEGKTLVHAWDVHPPRYSDDRARGLFELRNGKFETVCRVEPRTTIERFRP